MTQTEETGQHHPARYALPRKREDHVVPRRKMKQKAIRCVGAVLAIVGIMKFHSMLGFFFSFLPFARKLARDGLPVPGLESALILHCVFGTISILKIIGGIGLLGLRPWAKWIAAVAALSHVLFSERCGTGIFL